VPSRVALTAVSIFIASIQSSGSQAATVWLDSTAISSRDVRP